MRLRPWRRAVQLAFLALLVASPLLVARGVGWVVGTLYAMAFDPVLITDPLTGLQSLLLAWGATQALLVSLAPPLLLALVTGRTFCSWLCPQNTFSEWADALARRLGPRRRHLPNRPWPGRLLLAILLGLALATGVPWAALLSAPGQISLQIQRLATAGTLGVEALALGAILLLEARHPRVWCQHLCATGALLGLVRTPWTLRVVLREDPARVCTACGDCARLCPFALDPVKGGLGSLCHVCGDCLDACAGSTRGSAPLRLRLGP